MAKRAQILPPNDALKRKAVNPHKGVDLQLPPDTVKQLEEVVHRSRDRFTTDINARLTRLRQAHAKADESVEAHRDYVRLLYEESLQIKGAGGTIGLMLLTWMGKSLNDLVAGKTELDHVQMDVAALHIDALYVVLAQRIGGTGGMVEEQVLNGLESAVRRFA